MVGIRAHFYGWEWRIERTSIEEVTEVWPQKEESTPTRNVAEATYRLMVDGGERKYPIPNTEAEMLLRMHREGREDELQAWIDGFLTGKGANL